MYSKLVPFESIIEQVKDDTGIENLRNLYPKIRRFIYRAEKDIGFGGSTMLKRIKYSLEAGTILYDGMNYKVRLPQDILYLEAIGMCQEGMCPGDYRIQGDWMFFCGKKKVESFSLIYYTLLKDGEGNPVTTLNHKEAVCAGIVYWLYNSRRFSDKGSAQQARLYEEYYYDRIGEARGDDATPNTAAEWAKLSQFMRMSTKDIFLYSEELNCFCEIPESDMPVYDTATGTIGGGGGYTDPTGAPSGGSGVGDGTGEDLTGDGSYPDPNAPAPDPDPEPEPDPNLPPTIQDIEVTVEAGVTTNFSLEDFEGLAGAPYSDPENDALAEIRIYAINPYNTGRFFHNGVPLQVWDVYSRSQLAAYGIDHVGGDNKDFTTDSLSFEVRDGVNPEWIR